MYMSKHLAGYTSQNAITKGDLECILARNCESTEQLHRIKKIIRKRT